MKRLAGWCLSAMVVSCIVGCGASDVTGSSMEEAMKEREAKAKALDAKEGKTDTGLTQDKSQDPQ